MIIKIISGGQTGGDFGGLLAGVELGLETGGHCPANWKVEQGSNPDLEKYGVVCTKASGYPPRTRLNVANSDGTIGFGNQYSPGMKLTKKICDELGKPYGPIAYPSINSIEVIIKPFLNWILENNIQILNVAGNRESKNPGIEQFTKEFLVEVLSEQV